jgi:quinate dehydrogenase
VKPELNSLLPLTVGGGGTTRAAIFALSQMNLSPLYLLNRDADETAAIIATPSFAKYDLRRLDDAVLAAWGEGEWEKVRLPVFAFFHFVFRFRWWVLNLLL